MCISSPAGIRLRRLADNRSPITSPVIAVYDWGGHWGAGTLILCSDMAPFPEERIQPRQGVGEKNSKEFGKRRLETDYGCGVMAAIVTWSFLGP